MIERDTSRHFELVSKYQPRMVPVEQIEKITILSPAGEQERLSK